MSLNNNNNQWNNQLMELITQILIKILALGKMLLGLIAISILGIINLCEYSMQGNNLLPTLPITLVVGWCILQLWRKFNPKHFFVKREDNMHNIRIKAFLKNDEIAWKLQHKPYNTWNDVPEGNELTVQLWVEPIYTNRAEVIEAHGTLVEILSGNYNDESHLNHYYLKHERDYKKVQDLIDDIIGMHGDEFYMNSDGEARTINNQSPRDCTMQEILEDREEILAKRDGNSSNYQYYN